MSRENALSLGSGAIPGTMSIAGRRITLILLATIYGFGFIDRIVIALVAQQIKADYGVSDFEIGLLGGTAFAVVNTFASVPLAWLAERYSRKWIVSCSLFCASAFTVVGGAAGSFVHLFAARIGMAGGSAGTEAPPHSIISDLYPPEKRASALSLFMLGVPIAAILGSGLGGRIAEAYGWRMTFVSVGCLGIVVSLLALLLIREPARGATSGHDGEAEPQNLLAILRLILGDRCLRHVLIGASIVSLGSFGMNTFLPAFFARNFVLGPSDTGLAFGLLSGIASAGGTLLGGYGSEWLSRRDPRWLIAVPGVGAIVGAPIFVLGLFQTSLSAAFPLMLFGSFFFYMAMGPAIAAVHSLLGSRSRAAGSAIFLLIMHLVGQGLGPPIAGLISDTVSAFAFGGGNFATACAGEAGQVAGSACAAAGATGVRYAVACFGTFYLWSGGHMIWAALHRKTDLEQTAQGRAIS